MTLSPETRRAQKCWYLRF